MTKEELEKEAEEYADWFWGASPSMMKALANAYIEGAEPREKRIAELEAQIEKMKCCGNCLYNGECDLGGYEECKNFDKWELAKKTKIEGGVVGISGLVEKQYRPFKDCNELIEHYQRKYKSAVGCDIYFPSLYKPNIWIKSKVYKTEHLITGYDNDTKGLQYGSCICTSIYKWIDMKELFDNFIFLDGSLCGVEK